MQGQGSGGRDQESEQGTVNREQGAVNSELSASSRALEVPAQLTPIHALIQSED
jgi:hypothetical protein